MGRGSEAITREIAGIILVVLGTLSLLAVVTYHPLDVSPFAAGSDTVHNALSVVGAAVAGVLVTLLGVVALAVPLLLGGLGWRWLHGERVEAPVLQGVAWSAFFVFVTGLIAFLLGRSGYRGGEVTWASLRRENAKLEPNLKNLKA